MKFEEWESVDGGYAGEHFVEMLEDWKAEREKYLAMLQQSIEIMEKQRMTNSILVATSRGLSALGDDFTADIVAFFEQYDNQSTDEYDAKAQLDSATENLRKWLPPKELKNV